MWTRTASCRGFDPDKMRQKGVRSVRSVRIVRIVRIRGSIVKDQDRQTRTLCARGFLRRVHDAEVCAIPWENSGLASWIVMAGGGFAAHNSAFAIPGGGVRQARFITTHTTRPRRTRRGRWARGFREGDATGPGCGQGPPKTGRDPLPSCPLYLRCARRYEPANVAAMHEAGISALGQRSGEGAPPPLRGPVLDEPAALLRPPHRCATGGDRVRPPVRPFPTC